MSFLIPAAYAQEAAAGPAGSGFEWLFLVGFLVIFYLMIWRPQAKRAKEQRKMIEALQKGDEIATSSGLLGRITKVSGTYVTLQIAENVQVTVQKTAVQTLLPKGTLSSIEKE